MHVLLVDDEEELVATLAERLAMRGIEADWATNGDEALRKAGAASYDVAVLDVKLPKISGLELRRRLQQKCPGMKFIFVTGHGSEEDFKTGSAEAGEGYYLMKPVNIEALVGKMREAMGGKGEMP